MIKNLFDIDEGDLTAAQLGHIYRQNPTGIAASLAIACILFAFSAAYVPYPVTLPWLGLFAGILFWRFHSAGKATKALESENFDTRAHYRLLIVQVLATGLMWALVPVLFLPHTTIEVDLIVILSILMLTGASISYLAHVFPVYCVYLYSIVLPTYVP